MARLSKQRSSIIANFSEFLSAAEALSLRTLPSSGQNTIEDGSQKPSRKLLPKQNSSPSEVVAASALQTKPQPHQLLEQQAVSALGSPLNLKANKASSDAADTTMPATLIPASSIDATTSVDQSRDVQTGSPCEEFSPRNTIIASPLPTSPAAEEIVLAEPSTPAPNAATPMRRAPVLPGTLPRSLNQLHNRASPEPIDNKQGNTFIYRSLRKKANFLTREAIAGFTATRRVRVNQGRNLVAVVTYPARASALSCLWEPSARPE
ncbi:hypothetical protein HPB51_024592 [Rhipicephalus microplus]|uniref:Uncharacterized protein n=1 Tax=Rhipicephalus microplus TaxID=6941 RepID=A0A9J6EEF5_RHIMP|nr:hypothetical protein HPB51_024592 [Rhipicephalus microplus]